MSLPLPPIPAGSYRAKLVECEERVPSFPRPNNMRIWRLTFAVRLPDGAWRNLYYSLNDSYSGRWRFEELARAFRNPGLTSDMLGESCMLEVKVKEHPYNGRPINDVVRLRESYPNLRLLRTCCDSRWCF